MGTAYPEIDRNWLTKNRAKHLLRRLAAENERLMREVDKSLREYLVAMLDLTHRQLVNGRIGLSEYYRDTQMLANCAARLNEEE